MSYQQKQSIKAKVNHQLQSVHRYSNTVNLRGGAFFLEGFFLGGSFFPTLHLPYNLCWFGSLLTDKLSSDSYGGFRRAPTKLEK